MPLNNGALPLIVRVIDPYASLVKSGNYFLGYCPVCHSAPPKMAVRAELDQWHCYDCGAGGDVVDFLAAAEQVSIEDARELLAAFEGRGVEVLAPPEVKTGEGSAAGVDAKVLRGLLGKVSGIKGFKGAAVLRADGQVAASTNFDADVFTPLAGAFAAMLAGSQKILGAFSAEDSFAMIGIRNATRKLLRIHALLGNSPCIVLLELEPDANDALFRLAVSSYLAHHLNAPGGD